MNFQIRSLDNDYYSIKFQDSPKEFRVRTPKNMPKEKTVQYLKDIFSNPSEDILRGKAYIVTEDRRYLSLTHASSSDPFLSKVSNFFKKRNINEDQIELQLKEVPFPMGSFAAAPSTREMHLLKKEQPQSLPSALSLFTTTHPKDNKIGSFFEDGFTALGTTAFQNYITNVAQKDLKEDKELFTIKKVDKSDDQAPILALVRGDPRDAVYASNSETILIYYRTLVKTFGLEKVNCIGYEYGIDLLKMAEENSPLTPEIIYRMNIGMGLIEYSDVKELQGKLKEIKDRPWSEEQLNSSLKDLCYEYNLLPALTTRNLINILGAEEANLHDLIELLHDESFSPLIEKDPKSLLPLQFDLLLNLLAFTPVEQEKQYTGRKIEMAIQNAYTTGGTTEFKPWLDHQELLQTFPLLKQGSWEFFTESLAHIVCKKHLIHTDAEEKYRIGMLVPAPNLTEVEGDSGKRPAEEQSPRWYVVTGCINNSAGNVSYTLEPACSDSTLPAIKLFRSTASSPYAMDGAASVKNDMNPLNFCGYEGKDLTVPYEAEFFHSRTIPLWVAHQMEADSLITDIKNKMEKEEEGSNRQEISKAFDFLQHANTVLQQEYVRNHKLDPLIDIIRRHDHTIIDLFLESKEKASKGDVVRFHVILQKAVKLNRKNDEKPLSLEEEHEISLFLREMIFKCGINQNRIGLYKDLEHNIINREDSLKELAEGYRGFTDFYKQFEELESDVTAALADSDADDQQVVTILERWSDKIKSFAGQLHELPEDKTSQSLEVIGHSLGGALAQRTFAEYSLLQLRVPLPGQHMHLRAFDAPAISSKDASDFIGVGNENSELLRRMGEPIRINQRFESSDIVPTGGERHLGSTTVKEEEKAKNWLPFDAAIQQVLPTAKTGAVYEYPTVHASRFEDAVRDSALSRKNRELEGKASEGPAGDYTKTWLDRRMVAEFNQRSSSPYAQELKELWQLDRLFNLYSLEDMRPAIGTVMRFYGGLNLLGMVEDSKKKETLLKDWWNYTDKNAVFALTEKEGVVSELNKEEKDVFNGIEMATFWVANKEGFTFPDEDLAGAIAVCVDENVEGFEHKIVNFGQSFIPKLNKDFISSPLTQSSITHAFVILKNQPGSDTITIAEANGLGVRQDTLTLGEEEEASGYIIYYPKDEKLRAAIASNATIVTIETEDKEEEEDSSSIAPFDTSNMLKSAFRQNFYQITTEEKKVLADAVADLTSLEKIHKSDGKLQGFFSSSLALLIMQASFIMNSLDIEDLEKMSGKSREEISNIIFAKMMDPSSKLAQNMESMYLFTLHPKATTPSTLGHLKTKPT